MEQNMWPARLGPKEYRIRDDWPWMVRVCLEV